MNGAANRCNTITALLLVGIAVLPAHFIHLRHLGVYEDDYWAIVPFLHADLTTLMEYISYHFSIWMTGRPLNYVLPALMSAFGSRIAGLDGVYLLSALILATNCMLIYRILNATISAPTAVFGAVFYGLFPADTTRILLVHGAHVQGSMTFMLTGFALLLGSGKRRWLGYLAASLSLLTYESAFLPFLAAPLLWFTPSRLWFRRLTIHLTLCVLMIAVVAAVRLSKGDARALSVVGGPDEAFFRSITSTVIGPATSATQMVTAPIHALLNQDSTGLVLLSLGAVVLVLLLHYFLVRGNPEVTDSAGIPADPHLIPWQSGIRSLLTLFGSGMLFWSISYALAIVDPHYPPIRTLGRLTSVHVAAGFGATLCFTALMEAILRHSRPASRRIVHIAVSFYIAALFAHNLEIQRGYVQAWSASRHFWTQVIDLSPDVGPGTAILVEGEQGPQSPVIASNSWSDALVIQHFFIIPAGSEVPLLVMLNNSGPLLDFRTQNGVIRWKPMFWSGVEITLDPENVIVLKSDHGVLSRVDSVYIPAIGTSIRSKAPDGGLWSLPKSRFYSIMFDR